MSDAAIAQFVDTTNAMAVAMETNVELRDFGAASMEAVATTGPIFLQLMTGTDSVSRRFQSACQANVQTQLTAAKAMAALVERLKDRPGTAEEIIVAIAEREVNDAARRAADLLATIEDLG